MTGGHGTGLRNAHQVRLLQGGQALFDEMVGQIEHSVQEIRLETYIFAFDVAGRRVAQALTQAAQRGVQVYLVMDGVGTAALPPEWAERFDQAGVHWRIFRPLGYIGVLIPSRWRRMHRKLCVVDGRTAFCGGINVLDDWNDPNHGRLQAPRLDFAVQVSGPLVQSVHETMARFWWRLEAARAVRQADLSVGWQDLQRSVAKDQAARTGAGETDSVWARSATGPRGARAALLLRDNLRNRNRIERAYRKAIAASQREIIIANAYFLPGRKLRRALILAARRGVRVRLLLQGRYEYFMQFHAVRMVYGELLVEGIEIYEYEPSFLHAKVAVIDERWATVGSSNLEPLSLLLAREANVVVIDSAFSKDLRGRLLRAISEDGRRIDPDAYAQRPRRQRMLDAIAYGLMRAALFVTGLRY